MTVICYHIVAVGMYLPCKAKTEYLLTLQVIALLTLQVSRYSLLAFQSILRSDALIIRVTETL